MTCVGGRKLELVCILCNDSLADLEKACAGLLENSNNKHDNGGAAAEDGRCLDSCTVVSEPNSILPDGAAGFGPGGPSINLPPHFGGYMPLSDRNHKQVVATKCGHLFHQGCLRKHIQKTLTEGKGGSLFCPICTRPFAMNRLWPVIIPPTKAQQDRYLQLQAMKSQNAQMVKHLKEIRAKIFEEEERLKKIKEDSEQCLNDIQQKQNLLDSVNGPTSKEMAELTKVHSKRQEILHVVTQHNADLLKLLAEESNVSTAIAQNMIGTTANSQKGQVDVNQNYLPSSAATHSGGGKHPTDGNEYYPTMKQSATTKKDSRKMKKEKSRKKSRSKKKTRRRRHHHRQASSSHSKEKMDKGRGGEEEVTGEIKGYSLRAGAGGSGIYPPVAMPSAMIPDGNNNNPNPYRLNDKKQTIKAQCRKVDTFTKWNIESMKELMCLPGVSELNASHSSSIATGRDRNYPVMQSNQHGTSPKNSVNIILSRKPNMLEKDGVGGISKNITN